MTSPLSILAVTETSFHVPTRLGSWVCDCATPALGIDNAIASDKSALLSGAGPATFTNVTSYTRGINGIMVDISGPHPGITANDFTFKVGNNNLPSSWSAAPQPTTVTVRAGGGAVSGSDRVEILWADNAIQNQWPPGELSGSGFRGC